MMCLPQCDYLTLIAWLPYISIQLTTLVMEEAIQPTAMMASNGSVWK